MHQATQSNPIQALLDAGIVLPPAPAPLGKYARAARAGGLLFLSGMLPVEDGRPAFTGRVGRELSLEDAKAAARLAARNALAVAAAEAGSLDRIRRVVRLAVFLAAEPDFTQHAQVADAASEILLIAFGADRPHTRLAFGVTSLPAGMPVELEVIFGLSD
jgi:enamine deaminase RidA (YjgF/YER057c/UK114 family)